MSRTVAPRCTAAYHETIGSTLREGTRLGPYEVGGRIGAGGMGEVYRGRDSRLGRQVAIKLLPAALAADARFRLRFDREAKAISSLNHPNICALYDVGQDDGRGYLVMELCDGPTLAERLASGPLPIDQALRHAIEIARALETAHRNGVLHRDLKPGNVMLTRQGAKLVDFGLAITSEPENEESESHGSTQVRLTERGEIVGTVAYMAPEVLQGHAADARSDVFAFGLVLYEMVTGARPFEAPSRAALIGKVLETEPKAVRALRPDAPAALEQLIRACIAKDPDERIASAHDIRLQLEWIAVAPERNSETPKRSARPWLAAGVVALVLLTAIAGWQLLRTRPAAGSVLRPSRLSIDLRGAAPLGLGQFAPPIGYFSPLVAISNDGSTVVYVGVSGGETQLFRRRIDSFAIAPIAGTRGAHCAFFSPDDAWIGFLAGPNVMKVPAAGGAPVKLAEVAVPVSASWRSQDFILIFARQRGVIRVPANGGPAEEVGRRWLWYSDVLPGGRLALVRQAAEGSGDFENVDLVDLESGVSRTLIERGFDARYVDPGFITFARGGDLYVVPFDLERLEITGEPSLLQRGVAMESFWGVAQYSVSASGLLAFVPGGDRSIGRLAWLDRDGGVEMLPFPERLYGVFTLASDQTSVATEVSDVQAFILVLDLRRREERRLPVDGSSVRPFFIDDGLLYSNRPRAHETFRIARANPGGTGMTSFWEPEKRDALLVAASHDGSKVVAMVTDDDEWGIYCIDRTSGRPPYRMVGGGVASFSPDGRWLAFVSPRSGRSEIWVAPTSNLDAARQLSTTGGHEPFWCTACPELFFRVGTTFYAARIDEAGGVLEWDPPRVVWRTDFVDTRGISFAVSGDGSRLLISKRTVPDATDRILAIQNWTALVPPPKGR